MKKITNIFLLTTLMIGAISCKPKENMVYMEKQMTELDQEVKQAVFLGSYLQSGDLLDIKVTAFDDYAVRPFNLHSMNHAGNITDVQNQNAQTTPQGYLVDNEGYIIFPVLGKILVQNMTMSQLRENLESRLLEYLTDPMVSIRQLNFNITVLGEVQKPGQYTSSSDKVTIFQALGMAGDMTPGGERTRVKLLRNENGIDHTYVVNLTDNQITSSPYYYMQQNDVLYVEPDKNSQIAANSNPNRNLWFQIGGAALGVLSLIIGLTR